MTKRKEERLRQIRDILNEESEVRIVALAKRLNVTPETLRKDLNDLEQQSIVKREHGIVRIQKLESEMPISIRNQEHRKEKRSITIRAIEEIQDGQVVFLDSGSTLLQGIEYLKSKKDLTLVVNSFPIALECMNMGFKLLFLGGSLNLNGLRTDGHFAQEMLQSICIDVAILGTDGIKNASGFTVYSMEEVGTRRHIINHSRKLVIVSDASKFDTESHFRFCSFREADVFITNPLTRKQRELVSEVQKIVEVE